MLTDCEKKQLINQFKDLLDLPVCLTNNSLVKNWENVDWQFHPVTTQIPMIM